MPDLELKLYYQDKVGASMDVLEELERLQGAPGAPGIVKQNAKEAQPAWEREFTFAEAQYEGVKNGTSTLPLPPQEMRDKLAALCDAVEHQINVNKAANLAIDAASKLADLIADFKKLD